jgi:hypothetical protein
VWIIVRLCVLLLLTIVLLLLTIVLLLLTIVLLQFTASDYQFDIFKSLYDLISFDLLCFNATFSNISTISWRPVLVVEEAGIPGENHRPWASNW